MEASMTDLDGGRLNHIINLHAGEWADCKLCGALRLTGKMPGLAKRSHGE